MTIYKQLVAFAPLILSFLVSFRVVDPPSLSPSGMFAMILFIASMVLMLEVANCSHEQRIDKLEKK
jgi:ABC-type uncharacterized transport system permease subunit